MELLHQAHDLISPFGELVTTESPVVATIALSNMATCVEIRLPVPVVVWCATCRPYRTLTFDIGVLGR